MNQPANRPRYLVPRWHLFGVAAQQGEVGIHNIDFQSASKKEFVRARAEWKEFDEKTLGRASYLIGIALMIGDVDSSEVKEAAKFILETSPPASSGLFALANRIAGDSIASSSELLGIRENIRYLRRDLISYPKSAISWIDLARFHIEAGNQLKAGRAIRTALSLNVNSAFVWRSAIRYFLHVQDKEQALHVARRATRASDDALILASEIAVSQLNGKTPTSVRRARTVINDKPKDSIRFAELGVALTHLELGSGSDRKAKKLLKAVSGFWGENSAAQAVWLAPHLDLSEEIEGAIPKHAFEARYRFSKQQEDYKSAIVVCEQAVKFHSIASGLAEEGSFIASVYLEDFEQAVRIIDACNPDAQESFLIHNNKAYALAKLGRMDEAKVSHSRAAKLIRGSSISNDMFVHCATRGLLEFRSGNLDLGRAFYRKALDGFLSINRQKEVRLATIFWAEEEHIASTPSCDFPLLRSDEPKGQIMESISNMRQHLLSLPCVVAVDESVYV